MMIDCIWAVLIMISFFAAVFTGRMEELSRAVLSGVKDAVALTVSLLGIMGFWMGIMKISEKNGITNIISKALYPVLHLIFPKYKKDSKALNSISMNITANLLGLGNAATPFGLAAMSEMNKDRKGESATNEMKIFVLINTASLQLIPTTLLAMRLQYNSSDPFEIMPAVWITSSVVFICVITIGKLCERIIGGKTN